MILQSIKLTAIIQYTLFLIAYIFQTDKFTDISYGGTFVILAVYSFWNSHFSSSFEFTRQFVVSALVAAWGVRLALYLFIRILSMGSDDRFDRIRPYFIKYMGFWTIQTIAIIVISLPFLHLNSSANTSSFGSSWQDATGAAISVFGLLLETIADYQKFKFKQQKPKEFMCTGVWSIVRYPNYSGEIAFWIGIYISASVSNVTMLDYIVNLISPLFITWLLTRLSGIPLLEKKQAQNYGDRADFKDYTLKTAKLIPFVY